MKTAHVNPRNQANQSCPTTASMLAKQHWRCSKWRRQHLRLGSSMQLPI